MGALIGVGFGAGLLLMLSALQFRSPFGRHKSAVSNRVWPGFVDDVASALRAGVSIPNAIWQAGGRLPVALSAAFGSAQSRWEAGAGFEKALAELESVIAAPPFSQFIETVQLATTHGGNRLPALLVQLSETLRSQQALYDDVKGRQASTVSSARVAVAAPWVVLLMTSTRADVRVAYSSVTGWLVLAGVAWVCLISYLAMRRISRLKALEVLM